MLTNYAKIAVRHLLRQCLYSLINISGLAVGLAACMLILLLVRDELSYDRHHEKAAQIYRIVQENRSGDQVTQSALMAAVLAPTLQAYFPEITQVARILKLGPQLLDHGERRFYEKEVLYADPELFEVFDFVFLQGDPKNALAAPNSIVVTETLARKYFGREEPLGKMLGAHRVTGVLEDPPHNSHLSFTALISAATLTGWMMEEWYMHSAYTYLLLPDGLGPVQLERRFPDFVKGRVSGTPSLFLQPLVDIHLHSHLQNELKVNGDPDYLYIFSAIALLILFIACINFVNLSTARAGQRAREVGVRKVLGARRHQLVRQFLSEAVLISLIALVLALGIVEVTLPGFNALFSKTLDINLEDGLPALAGFVLVALCVGVLSGSYSAFFLSSFRPVQVLHGVLKSGSLEAWLRKGLVVFQFAISTTLIVAALVIYAQLHYVQYKDLGFDREQVVVISGVHILQDNYAAFKRELLAHASVLQVTSGSPPGVAPRTEKYKGGSGEMVTTYSYDVDYDYVETLGLELLAGRNFSTEHATDAKGALIVNQVHETVFGEKKSLLGERVIGVIKDFHIFSLHRPIAPLRLRLRPGVHSLLVRIDLNDVAGTLAFMREQWGVFVPERPFVYSFLDDDWARLYRAEQKLGNIIGVFSALAVLVACLGLFGLASFAAERRTKEIGIRKVLGASVANIAVLLSRDFTRLVLLANVIAWPLVYYAAQHWLQEFTYRIDIGLEYFALGGATALIIAWATVGWQAVRAGMANPVDSLRYE